MARVLRQGAEIVLTCTTCDSKVAFEFSDLVMPDVTGPDYCVCPECKSKVPVIRTTWPQSWRRLLAEQEGRQY